MPRVPKQNTESTKPQSKPAEQPKAPAEPPKMAKLSALIELDVAAGDAGYAATTHCITLQPAQAKKLKKMYNALKKNPDATFTAFRGQQRLNAPVQVFYWLLDQFEETNAEDQKDAA